MLAPWSFFEIPKDHDPRLGSIRFKLLVGFDDQNAHGSGQRLLERDELRCGRRAEISM